MKSDSPSFTRDLSGCDRRHRRWQQDPVRRRSPELAAAIRRLSRLTWPPTIG